MQRARKNPAEDAPSICVRMFFHQQTCGVSARGLCEQSSRLKRACQTVISNRQIYEIHSAPASDDGELQVIGFRRFSRSYHTRGLFRECDVCTICVKRKRTQSRAPFEEFCDDAVERALFRLRVHHISQFSMLR